MNDELTREEIVTGSTDPEQIRGVSEWQGPGAKLRQARERQNLSLEDVAAQIKIATRKLTALEEERWQELPERPYLRGLVRNYARVVQLDPEPLLRSVDAAVGGSGAPPALHLKPALQAPFPHRPQGPHESPVNKLIVAGVLGCIVIIAVLVLPGIPEFHHALAIVAEYFHRDAQPAVAAADPAPSVPSVTAGNADPSSAPANPVNPPAASHPAAGTLQSPLTAPVNPAAASAATSAAPPGTPPQVAASSPAMVGLRSTPLLASNAADAGGAVTMQFRDDSWVEVRQADGKLVSSQIYHGGTEQSIAVSAPLQIVIGNAPAVSLSYRGQPVDLDAYTRARVARVNLP